MLIARFPDSIAARSITTLLRLELLAFYRRFINRFYNSNINNNNNNNNIGKIRLQMF